MRERERERERERNRARAREREREMNALGDAWSRRPLTLSRLIAERRRPFWRILNGE